MVAHRAPTRRLALTWCNHPGPVSRRCTTAIVVVLVTLWLLSTAGGAAAPVLMSANAAVVLALLTPRAAFVAAAATQLPLAIFLPMYVTRLSLGDPLHYALGRAHGGSSLRWVAIRSPHCAGGLQRAERLVRRVGLPMTALVPTGSVMAVAGAVQLPFAAAMALNLLGTTARVLALWLAARAAPDVVVVVGDLVSVAVPAAVLVLIAGAVRDRLRRRSITAARVRHPSLAGAWTG